MSSGCSELGERMRFRTDSPAPQITGDGAVPRPGLAGRVRGHAVCQLPPFPARPLQSGSSSILRPRFQSAELPQDLDTHFAVTGAGPTSCSRLSGSTCLIPARAASSVFICYVICLMNVGRGTVSSKIPFSHENWSRNTLSSRIK